MKIRRIPSALALMSTVVGLSVLAPVQASADTTSPYSYVSLGDSYTSGSGIVPTAPGSIPVCTQTSLNYPHLVAQQLGLELHDASCGGATVHDMAGKQFGFVAPQFNALKTSTDVISISIGGNDSGLFATAIAACGPLNLLNAGNYGAPCKTIMGSYFDKLIESDAPNIGAALDRIHTLSPNAKVFVIGYPPTLPQSGNCYPQIPLGTGDTTYLNGIQKHVNSMLATQAASHDATYVDIFTPAIGHDACKSPSVRWIEPLVPSRSAGGFPVLHPNAAGEAATSTVVKAAFSAAGIG